MNTHYTYPTIVKLRKGEGRALKAGGLWVYDNEIDTVTGDAADGEMVTVLDFDGYFLGYGFINRSSKITVRIMSRRQADIIDADFIAHRVAAAWQLRKTVLTGDVSSCRLIHGDADGFSGLTVDKFEDILVVESLALGIEKLKPTILAKLTETLEASGITIRGIYERSDSKDRDREGMSRFKGYIGEAFDTHIIISENGVRYHVDVADGQKTGFFLDQRANRKAVAMLCPGMRVLDCFTHTGAFALNAALSGAASVLGVDASTSAIDVARANAELNALGNVEFITADVLDFLPEQERAGSQYDVIILDPPAFAKSRQAVKGAITGYRDINMRAMRLVRDGGYLATCTCSSFMTHDIYARTLEEAARAAHRRIQQVYVGAQGPDHPILWGADSSAYLQFYIFRVLRDERK